MSPKIAQKLILSNNKHPMFGKFMIPGEGHPQVMLYMAKDAYLTAKLDQQIRVRSTKNRRSKLLVPLLFY
jgi:hypothetical protein